MAQKSKERGICELYENDPEQADWLVFGRRAAAGAGDFCRVPASPRWRRWSVRPFPSAETCPPV